MLLILWRINNWDKPLPAFKSFIVWLPESNAFLSQWSWQMVLGGSCLSCPCSMAEKQRHAWQVISLIPLGKYLPTWGYGGTADTSSTLSCAGGLRELTPLVPNVCKNQICSNKGSNSQIHLWLLWRSEDYLSLQKKPEAQRDLCSNLGMAKDKELKAAVVLKSILCHFLSLCLYSVNKQESQPIMFSLELFLFKRIISHYATITYPQ